LRWWQDHDQQALDWLLRHGAQYSGTRDLKNATAAFGEYLVWREFGGTRNAQASALGDVNPVRRRRIIEVKTTCGKTNGWSLRYRRTGHDYALVRLDPESWRTLEAWLVPLPVAQRHAEGGSYRISARGSWRSERHVRRLHLGRF
jgi:hypothetical protein